MYGLLNNQTNFVCWDKKSGHSREVASLSRGTTVVEWHICISQPTIYNNSLNTLVDIHKLKNYVGHFLLQMLSVFFQDTWLGPLQCKYFFKRLNFTKTVHILVLYYYMKNYCNFIGLQQWYFSLIWNTYMWKLQTFCG